ncbi:MAG: amidohydrolase family protein, partial [Acidobacteriota bacterium]
MKEPLPTRRSWRKVRANARLPAGLLLENLRWYSERREFSGDLRLAGGRVIATGSRLVAAADEVGLDLSGCLAFPGLINAHDHLALNLLPRLGNPPYRNFYQWAQEIYRPNESPIHEMLQVPLEDRLWWGAYRNLICGVTTVAHHDPYYSDVFARGFPVKVLDTIGWSHSLGYGGDVVASYQECDGKPFIIHAAEGVDESSALEVDRLDELGVLGSNTVIVHGVALTPRQIDRLSGLGAGLVWCPVSNKHLYDATAPVQAMKGKVTVALGTDSTLSGSANLLEELKEAAHTGLATPTELVEMVTGAAAELLQLHDGRGSLSVGAPADLLVIPAGGSSAAECLLSATVADLALVLVDGAVHLAAPELAASLGLGPANVIVAGAEKWIYGDPGALKSRIECCAGDRHWARNPL